MDITSLLLYQRDKYEKNLTYEIIRSMIDKPDTAPFKLMPLIKRLKNEENSEADYKLQVGLIACQMYYTLNINEDLELNSKKVTMARWLEKMIFGRNTLFDGPMAEYNTE